MSEKFLSRDDIREMTRTPQRARQVAFFVRNGIRHYVDEHGWPVVTWAAVEGQRDVPKSPPVWRSNLEKDL
jgi:hypothetical protein